MIWKILKKHALKSVSFSFFSCFWRQLFKRFLPYIPMIANLAIQLETLEQSCIYPIQRDSNLNSRIWKNRLFPVAFQNGNLDASLSFKRHTASMCHHEIVDIVTPHEEEIGIEDRWNMYLTLNNKQACKNTRKLNSFHVNTYAVDWKYQPQLQ